MPNQKTPADNSMPTAFAVAIIFGICRMIFGSEFGGLLPAFGVIVAGSVIGPWVASLFASEPTPTPADETHGASASHPSGD